MRLFKIQKYILTVTSFIGCTLLMQACGSDNGSSTIATNALDANSIDASFSIAFSNDSNGTALQDFVNNHGSVSARIWYTYDGLTASNGASSNIIQPVAGMPATVSSGSSTTTDWSVAMGAGSVWSSGASVSVKGLPLNKSNTTVAIELLQSLSDGKIHPVAYVIYAGGAQPLTREQLSADLAAGFKLTAGRTCGAAAKVQSFSAPLQESAFLAACP